MTENSLLCNFIKDNHVDWRERLSSKDIRVKDSDDGHFHIFNYGVSADFHDPIVQESRGIIIMGEADPTVVCRPYRKFGNFAESYADAIDWTKAVVEEKIDGSIIKLWHDPVSVVWQWSTNGAIKAGKVQSFGGTGTFMDLIKETIEYREACDIIDKSGLDPACTYIFELTGPDNQIVVEYSSPKLYLTGIRNNETGKETDPMESGLSEIFPVPARYMLGSETACIRAAEKLNPPGGEVQKEGFVVVDPSADNPDGSFNRVKIKSPEYVALHHKIANGISKKKALDIIMDYDASAVPHTYRTDAVLSWYRAEYTRLLYSVSQYINYARGLLAEYNGDRKAVAAQIKDDLYALFGFASLGNDRTPEELVRNTKMSVLEKLIKDYKSDNIYRKKPPKTSVL